MWGLGRRVSRGARNLDRKVFDVNEAPHLYADRIEHVNDIMTALLRESARTYGRNSGGIFLRGKASSWPSPKQAKAMFRLLGGTRYCHR